MAGCRPPQHFGATGQRVPSAPPTAGVYPALDRFGRTVRHVWADGALTVHGSLTTVPNRPAIVELGHTYDRAGSRLSSIDLRPGNQWPMSWEYEYDGLHRLTVADRGTWDGSALGSGSVLTQPKGGQQWTLDPLGNWDGSLRSLRTTLRVDTRSLRDCAGKPALSPGRLAPTGLNGQFNDGEIEDRTHNGVNELLTRTQGTGGTDETLTFDHAGNLRTRVADSVTTTYTHDAWNRLVKVEVGAATILEQQHNGLRWRTWKRTDTTLDGDLDEERTYAYAPSWQLLEERIDRDFIGDPGLDARVQHVWGKRYIDDIVLHRRDENNDGDYADTHEGTWYHVTDAMFSTVALMTPGGAIAERVSYTPYGEARHHRGNDVTGDGSTGGADLGVVLDSWNTTIGDTGYRPEADLNRDGVIDGGDLGMVLTYGAALEPGLISDPSAGAPDNTIGWDGYVFDAATLGYTVRNRTYLPELGRWVQRDPAGYVDGGNLYQYGRSQTLDFTDPTGLQGIPAGPARAKPVAPHQCHPGEVRVRSILRGCTYRGDWWVKLHGLRSCQETSRCVMNLARRAFVWSVESIDNCGACLELPGTPGPGTITPGGAANTACHKFLKNKCDLEACMGCCTQLIEGLVTSPSFKPRRSLNTGEIGACMDILCPGD